MQKSEWIVTSESAWVMVPGNLTRGIRRRKDVTEVIEIRTPRDETNGREPASADPQVPGTVRQQPVEPRGPAPAQNPRRRR